MNNTSYDEEIEYKNYEDIKNHRPRIYEFGNREIEIEFNPLSIVEFMKTDVSIKDTYTGRIYVKKA